MEKEQELYDKLVDVLNTKLDNPEISAKDLTIVLDFLKYNGIQASRKHEGLNNLAGKAAVLPFDDDEEDSNIVPLQRVV